MRAGRVQIGVMGCTIHAVAVPRASGCGFSDRCTACLAYAREAHGISYKLDSYHTDPPQTIHKPRFESLAIANSRDQFHSHR